MSPNLPGLIQNKALIIITYYTSETFGDLSEFALPVHIRPRRNYFASSPS